MSQNPAFDSSIPVLTEVVLEPLPGPAASESALQPASQHVPESASQPASQPTLKPPSEPARYAGQTEGEVALAVAAELVEAPLPDEPDAAAPAALQPLPVPDWDALESRIVERVVAQLQPQIDAVVRKALASAGDQIHIGLRQAIEQVVAQQVAAIEFGQQS